MRTSRGGGRTLRSVSALLPVPRPLILLLARGGGLVPPAVAPRRRHGSRWVLLCLCLLVLEDGPVKHVIVLVALADEQLAEELAQERVVGLVVEAEGAAELEVRHELHREVLAENLDGGGHLLLADLLILLLLGGRLEPLPGQAAAEEVHEHVPQGLEVVATALLDTQMRVDGSVARGPRQVLVLPVRDVLVRLRVAVLLRQPEIDDVHLVRPLPQPHKEVIRLDVAVNEALRVHVLDSRYLRRGRSAFARNASPKPARG
mmetsp:Transcript_49756/g.158932  ORF Transcript_49756/g.158932 Transcript_49756/m.158932 type:complete len:260 (-) Transcript_49756:839-1618(-)